MASEISDIAAGLRGARARGLGLEVVLLPVGSLSAVAAFLGGTADGRDEVRPRFAASDEREPE